MAIANRENWSNFEWNRKLTERERNQELLYEGGGSPPEPRDGGADFRAAAEVIF